MRDGLGKLISVPFLLHVADDGVTPTGQHVSSTVSPGSALIFVREESSRESAASEKKHKTRQEHVHDSPGARARATELTCRGEAEMQKRHDRRRVHLNVPTSEQQLNRSDGSTCDYLPVTRGPGSPITEQTGTPVTSLT